MSSSHQGFHAEHFVEGEGEGGNVGCGEHFRCGCEITLMFIFTLYTIYNYFCEDKVVVFFLGGGVGNPTALLTVLMASERSERDTLRSVQSRIADIYILLYRVRANFVLITRKEGGA